jgi:nitrate reductase gamma subunit
LSSLATPALVGIILGAIVGVLLLVGVGFFIYRRIKVRLTEERS